MKKTILSIAVIAAAFVAASCQKENLQENTAPEGNASIFTATIETGADTKTTVERVTSPSVAYKTKWESTDQISINGVTYTATPDGTDATKATFTKNPDTQNDPAGTYKAYFPATMYNDSKATLPASYTYADGKYNMPMYAESDNTTLSFKNLCGVLAITVNGTDFTSVSSIEVSSDKQMNGEFSATSAGVLTFASKTLTDADKKVTLTFTSAKTIAVGASATFYIPVPANTHNPLTIKVTNGSTVKTMVTKKSGGVAVDRNTVYPITFKEPTTGEADVLSTAGISGNKVKWVQLWAGGPKFAEVNVGVTDGKAESYGGYYNWGMSEVHTSSNYSNYKSGTDPLTGADDTATKLWGSKWRMPTQTELQGLIDNCDVAWTTVNDKTGRKFTGKGAYASNSVFLPAAGRCDDGDVSDQGNYGDYWSSTPYESHGAYDLNFKSGGQSVDYSRRSRGYSVRAVLAE